MPRHLEISCCCYSNVDYAGTRKAVVGAKKAGPKRKNVKLSSKPDSTNADIISDESPDLQSSSVSVTATLIDHDERVQQLAPKKKVVRKVSHM